MTVQPLRRVFAVVNGGTPTSEPENWDGEVAWATPIDLGRLNGSRISETQRTLTSEGLRTGSSLVPAGSLIVSTRAPIGYVAETTTPMAFNQGCRGLVPRIELDVRFFRYQLLVSADQLQSRGQGSTFVELSTDALASFPLTVPPLREQCAIADYLDEETARIDSLLDLRRRQAKLLLDHRRAVIDGFIVPEALGGRADPESAWPIAKLKRAARFFADGDWIESPFITTDGIRLIQTGNIGEGAYRDQGFRYISDETFETLGCTEVLPGDILISRLAGTVGRSCLAPDLGTRMVVSVDVVIMRPVSGLDPAFVVTYLSSSYHLALAGLLARGTTMPRLSRSQVGEFPLPMPPLDVQRRVVGEIERRLGSVNALLVALDQQVARLLERRQALITAAVTGQLEIPGVAA